MSKARKLIEGVDDPESFDVKAHLMSPVARLASTNGFVRKDRDAREERWVKKLIGGREAWLVTEPDSSYDDNRKMDYRDPQRHGGRSWNFILAQRSNACSVCQGTGNQAGGECQPCNSTGRQKKSYFTYSTLASANELTMNALLGAILQRLATWPAHKLKP